MAFVQEPGQGRYWALIIPSCVAKRLQKRFGVSTGQSVVGIRGKHKGMSWGFCAFESEFVGQFQPSFI